MQAISLVIPTYNRYTMLLECVQHVLNDPRIAEICISDDCSTDGSFEKLVQWAGSRHSKIRIHRNQKNLDCYVNKARAVQLAKNPWAILFDDDNILPTAYLDTLFDLSPWNPNMVYCPEFAQPHFDYTAFSGATVTRRNVAALMQRKHFATALNTANYFLHKDTWLGVWDGSLDPHTADSIYQAYRLLSAGKRLYITPGLHYFHRVHDGSHFKRENHKTGRFATEVETKLKQLR